MCVVFFPLVKLLISQLNAEMGDWRAGLWVGHIGQTIVSEAVGAANLEFT